MPGLWTSKSQLQWYVDCSLTLSQSGHPATWSISFTGTPYDKDLDDIESDSEDDSDDSSEGKKPDYDVNGMELEPQDKQWFVGVTCNSNVSRLSIYNARRLPVGLPVGRSHIPRPA